MDGGDSGGVITSLYISILFLVSNAERPPTASAVRIEIIYGLIFIIIKTPPFFNNMHLKAINMRINTFDKCVIIFGLIGAENNDSF